MRIFIRSSTRHYLKRLSCDASVVNLKPTVKEWLINSKLTYAHGHSSFLVTPCPFCNKNSSTTLFINKTTGSSVCKPCNLRGSWSEITKLLKQQRQNKPRQMSQQLQKLLPTSLDNNFWSKQCIPWKQANSAMKNNAVKMYKLEKLKNSHLEKYGVSLTTKSNSNSTEEVSCLVFPWYTSSDGLLPDSVKIETIAAKENQATDCVPKEGLLGLFGWRTVPDQANKLILTANEFDAIAVHQSTGLPAVSLPLGSSALPLEVLPQLEKFSTIYLWFDSNASGRLASAQFARKLNLDRCWIIHPPSEKQQFSSALDALNKGLDLREIINSAKSASHKQIVTFPQLREEVYSEFLNADQVAGVKWKRFPELSRVLKGFRPGELTILTGPTGSGKTTLMSELSLDLCSQGVSTLWGSFEVKNIRLVKTMLKQFSGVNLDKHLDQYEHWANRYQELPLYYMGFHGPMETIAVIETMAHAVYVHDIQHVIIDNLQFMIGNKTRGFDDSFFAQNFAVAKFRHFASSKNVHVTVIMHPRKEDEGKPLQTSSIFGTAKATQESDNVMILQSQPKSDKYLQITKNRFSGDVGKVPIHFNKTSLTMSGFFEQSNQHELNIGKKYFRKVKSEPFNEDRELLKAKPSGNDYVVHHLKPLKHRSNGNLPVSQSKPSDISLIADEDTLQ